MYIGIDLGTTFCSAACLTGNERLLLIPDVHHKQLTETPSAVLIDDTKVLVGKIAEHYAEQFPNVVLHRFFKRAIGTHESLFIDRYGRNWYPESFSALLLKKLANDFEMTHGTMQGCVITIPAYFTATQRKAVQNAALLANIPLMDIIEEPVAAAYYYTYTQGIKQENILVYDFGGGTFDVSVIAVSEKGIYVQAKEGLNNLGGKEIDELLMDIMLQQIGTIADTLLSPAIFQKLRAAAEDIKKQFAGTTTLLVKYPLHIGNKFVDIVISRAQFYNKLTPLLLQTLSLCTKCVAAAGFTIQNIDTILLVGGSSHFGLIKDLMIAQWGVSPAHIQLFQPQHAVCLGAALYANRQTGSTHFQQQIPSEFRGISSYNIGVRTYNALTQQIEIDTIIKKNAHLPISNSKIYYTKDVSQRRILFDIVQYQDDVKEAAAVGVVEVVAVAGKTNNYAVELHLEYHQDGTVTVEVYDPQWHTSLQKTFANKPEETQFLLQQKKLLQQITVNNILTN